MGSTNFQPKFWYNNLVAKIPICLLNFLRIELQNIMEGVVVGILAKEDNQVDVLIPHLLLLLAFEQVGAPVCSALWLNNNDWKNIRAKFREYLKEWIIFALDSFGRTSQMGYPITLIYKINVF
ncbi:hypothetical protein ACJX0J_005567 [Zea mays]